MKANVKRFCLYMIAGLPRKEAAIKAGSSESSASNNACRWLKSDEVKAFIRQHQPVADEAQAKAAGVDRAYVLRELVDNSELAKAQRGQNGPNLTASNQALGMIGKHLGMFVDRSEVVMSSEVKTFLDEVMSILDEEITDQELMARLLDRFAAMPSLAD